MIGAGELRRRIDAGDVTALEVVYDDCGAAAYTLARSCSLDGERAEEVVREVFLGLWAEPDRIPRSGQIAVEVLRRVRALADGAAPDAGGRPAGDVAPS